MATVEMAHLGEIAARVGLKSKLLTDKVAVITGASRGIGAAIARELGAYGSYLVLNYARNAELAEALAKEIQEVDLPDQPGSVVAIQANVSNKDEATRLMDAVWQQFGRLDILVNNAGVTHDHTFRKMTVEEWEEVIGTDLNGVF